MNKLQQFVREKCVMAAHPGCKNLEEVRAKQFFQVGSDPYSELINPPLTLSRVLNAVKYLDLAHIVLSRWLLINPNSSDALFEDQSEETKLAIAKLLGWEEEG